MKSAKSGDLSIFIGRDTWVDSFINKFNKNGESRLYVSAMHGHYPIVHWSIFRGADVNFQVKKDGNSPLHIASIHGHVSLVRFLVTSRECQKDLVNKSGKTAIQEAGYLEKMTILKLKKAKNSKEKIEMAMDDAKTDDEISDLLEKSQKANQEFQKLDELVKKNQEIQRSLKDPFPANFSRFNMLYEEMKA